MQKQTATMDGNEYESIHDLVDSVEEGDTFQIYANEYRVAKKVESDVRPYLKVQKKSIGGWMTADGRIEQADPTKPDADETIIYKIDRKHGWDERFTCDISEVEA
jgi:hypothetical protein